MINEHVSQNDNWRKTQIIPFGLNFLIYLLQDSNEISCEIFCTEAHAPGQLNELNYL